MHISRSPDGGFSDEISFLHASRKASTTSGVTIRDEVVARLYPGLVAGGGGKGGEGGIGGGGLLLPLEPPIEEPEQKLERIDEAPEKKGSSQNPEKSGSPPPCFGGLPPPYPYPPPAGGLGGAGVPINPPPFAGFLPEFGFPPKILPPAPFPKMPPGPNRLPPPPTTFGGGGDGGDGGGGGGP